MLIPELFSTNSSTSKERLQFCSNKRIPAVIEKNVLTALSFYPELKNTSINFIFKKDLKTSVMQAQPVFTTLLRSRKNRSYRIIISSKFRLIKDELPILQIPDEVMVGWIGHELGHILDYEGKTNKQLVSFGYNYYFNSTFVKHAEMVADSLAVERGMGNYIVSTKRFILDHAGLPQAYKDKIARLYLSPDVIVEQVKVLKAKMLKEEKLKETATLSKDNKPGL